MSRLPLALAAAFTFALAAPAAAQDTTRIRPGSRSITLPEATRIALAQNSTVRFAGNNVALDSLAVRAARNAFLPNLSASSSSSQGFEAGSQGQNNFSFSVGLNSGLTLYNGNQNRNALRGAELSARASGASLLRARQTVAFQVATDFLALITQQEQLRVQQENLAAQQQELVQLEQFVQRGTRPIGDLYQQQAAVASTRLAAANARRATELAKTDLVQELVLDPRLDWTFVPPRGVLEGTPRKFDLDSLVNVAMAQRVDLVAQQLRVRAAQTEVLIAEGTAWPTVTGSAGYGSGYNNAGDGSFMTQLNQRRGGSVGIGVTVPIFDRGAASIATQRARVQLENELLTLRDAEQAVALDVRRAYLDYLAAQEQLAAADAQQKAAQLALEAAQARYRVGLATFVEVTLARASLIQAQSAVVSARSSEAFQQALMSYFTGVLDPANAILGA